MTSEHESGSEAAFEAASRELYRERPEGFVAARNRAVREARGRGQRDLATRLAGLRRPNLSLWLANRLHEVAPHQLKDLLAVAGQMQAAQARAARGDAAARKQFRELIARHSHLIEELVRAGLSFAEQNGQGAGEEVGRRLGATLRAASAEPEEGGRRLAEGALLAEPEPAGFELMSGVPAAPMTEAGEAFSGEETSRTTEAAETGKAPEATSALEATARAAEARRTAAERERAAIAARSRADELARKASALAREAGKAREEAEAAGLRAEAAEREAADARQAAQEAAARARRR